ncbi:hypothetical protein E8E14_008251 [Neopestalotiopsis sp. 37M]|nr:hypothetical protein E8E14_008251 [Neopestalotiopsis sp. 37M]
MTEQPAPNNPPRSLFKALTLALETRQSQNMQAPTAASGERVSNSSLQAPKNSDDHDSFLMDSNDKPSVMRNPGQVDSLPKRLVPETSSIGLIGQMRPFGQTSTGAAPTTSASDPITQPIPTFHHQPNVSLSSFGGSNGGSLWCGGAHRRDYSQSTYDTSVLSQRGPENQHHGNPLFGNSRPDGEVVYAFGGGHSMTDTRNENKLQHHHQTVASSRPFGGLRPRTGQFAPTSGTTDIGYPCSRGLREPSSLTPLAAPFIPMSDITRTGHAQFPRPGQQYPPFHQTGRPTIYNSNNYKGNPRLPGNQSADILEEDSCALWITNLNLDPARAYSQLLGAIRDCGKVYACFINCPDPMSGHSTFAAKLVFFDAGGAKKLRSRALRGEFVVNGYVPVVRYNRIRTASQPPGPESRVLHIEGPSDIISQDKLDWLFNGNFQFETEDVRILSEDAGRRRLEWRFGSFRCQAASAKKLIEERRRAARGEPRSILASWGHVNVFYGLDPCATVIGA